MTSEPDLFLVAAASETAATNIDRTLVGGVAAEYYGQYSEYLGDDPAPIWGITGGKADHYADKITAGDLLLFYTGDDQRGEKSYTYLATVQATEWNEPLANTIWVDEQGNPGVDWPFIIFLADVRRVTISSRKLHDDLGYSPPHLQDFRRVIDGRIQPHLSGTTRRGYLRGLSQSYEPVVHENPLGSTSAAGQQTLSAGSPAVADDEDRTPASREVPSGDSAVDRSPPPTIRTEVTRTIRDTALATQLKGEHDHRCQLCGVQRRGPSSRNYAEAHHLHPLGDEPPGFDIEENILVLCPNHHADFDYGLVRIDPDTHAINHAYETFDEPLRTVPGHTVGATYLTYNNDHVASFE